jgi:hypothetical protein
MRPIVDRAIFWVVDRFDDLKHRIARGWVADDETSALCARVDDELDLLVEVERILQAQRGRSN